MKKKNYLNFISIFPNFKGLIVFGFYCLIRCNSLFTVIFGYAFLLLISLTNLVWWAIFICFRENIFIFGKGFSLKIKLVCVIQKRMLITFYLLGVILIDVHGQKSKIKFHSPLYFLLPQPINLAQKHVRNFSLANYLSASMHAKNDKIILHFKNGITFVTHNNIFITHKYFSNSCQLICCKDS